MTNEALEELTMLYLKEKFKGEGGYAKITKLKMFRLFMGLLRFVRENEKI